MTKQGDLSRIRAIISANQAYDREQFEGLETWEIRKHERSLKFGNSPEPLPSRALKSKKAWLKKHG